ncbi:MAG: PepSY-associated TM helix domain-containing protein [Brasilonema sp.]
MKLRKLALILHRYIGIVTGLLLVIISLTGSLLIFSEELDHFFNPQFLQVTPQVVRLSPQEVVEIAQKTYPDLKTNRIIVPHQPEQVYTVLMQSPNGGIDVYINPYTGAVLGSRPYQQTLRRILVNLHASFFAGDIGLSIAGICGIVFLLLSVTGLLLWNGWHHLYYGFKIRWKSPWQLLNYDLHKLGGVLSVVLLCILGFTGAALNFATPFESTIYWLTHSPSESPAPTSKVVAGIPPISIDALLEKAKTTLPNAEIARIYPAKEPEATFNVLMELPQENEFNKSTYLSLDQYTGELLQLQDPRKASLAKRILSAQGILHFGTYGGLVTRILYFIVGLMPLGLFVTGLIIWQQRRWAEARRKEAKKVATSRLTHN